MGEIDGGEVLVRGLEAEGVQAIFAISDISYTPIQRSAQDRGIRMVAARHESANVHMAEAWARSTGVPAIAMAGMGPGVANMLPAVVTAWIEGYPVILIGTQRTDRADRSIRRGRFQHTPQIDVFRPITKFAAVVPDAERLAEHLREAFRAAMAPRRGPVYLELPVQVLRETVDEDALAMPAPERYRVTPAGPDSGATEAVAELLAEADMPLLLAGQGVLQAQAWEELRALAEHAGALVMTSPGARGAVPEDDPRTIGIPMLSPGGARAAQEADLVVAVGTAVGEMLGYGRPPQWPPPAQQRWAQLDADPASIGVNREVDAALLGDARAGLTALREALAARSGPRALPDAARECAELERDLLAQVAGSFAANEAYPIHPARLAGEVAGFFGPEAVAVFDGGNTALWAFLLHRIGSPRSLLWTSHFGHLGTGLPYAIGARLARPDRPVYLYTGDSAFGFNLAELETAARERVDLVIVVACDYSWAMEAAGQEAEIGRTIGLETARVRYDEVARGLGCGGEFVDRAEDIGPALERAAATPGPVVVHVEVNPAENISPPFLAEFIEMYEAKQ